MTIEELQKKADDTEIYFLDVLALHHDCTDKVQKADRAIVQAKHAYEIASIDYQLSFEKYSLALAEFLTARREYISARSDK